MAVISRLRLLSPYLDNPAFVRITTEKEVKVFQTAFAELFTIVGVVPPVVGIRVYFPQLPVLFRTCGKFLTYSIYADIMDFSEETDIPTSEVPHVAVNEEIVRLNVVCPTVTLVISPTEPFLMNDKTTDHELFHCPCMHRIHPVQLHVALEDCAHCLAEFLLVAVSGRTCRFFHLTSVNTEDGFYKSADEIVFQRYVALTLDVLLFRHALSVNDNDVIPLLAVCVVLVAFTLKTELVHVGPMLLRLQQNVEDPPLSKFFGSGYRIHFICFADAAEWYKSFLCHVENGICDKGRLPQIPLHFIYYYSHCHGVHLQEPA